MRENRTIDSLFCKRELESWRNRKSEEQGREEWKTVGVWSTRYKCCLRRTGPHAGVANLKIVAIVTSQDVDKGTL